MKLSRFTKFSIGMGVLTFLGTVGTALCDQITIDKADEKIKELTKKLEEAEEED